jgi:hypothetical protein
MESAKRENDTRQGRLKRRDGITTRYRTSQYGRVSLWCHDFVVLDELWMASTQADTAVIEAE